MSATEQGLCIKRRMPLNDQELCACGKPLHYLNPTARRITEESIAIHGPYVTVTVTGKGSWKVPRHYIALHGLYAPELEELAQKYGFEKVSSESQS
jgi:hypothetical protein